jgi:hypothetical protein
MKVFLSLLPFTTCFSPRRSSSGVSAMPKLFHYIECPLFLITYNYDKNLQFSIYQKPTQTDIIIPNSSCDPYEHKLSGINYLLDRLHTYPITEKAKDAEKNTINKILHSNKYTNLITKTPPPSSKNKNKIHMPTRSIKKRSGLPTHTAAKREITKLFRDTRIKVAFRTQNTIQNN